MKILKIYLKGRLACPIIMKIYTKNKNYDFFFILGISGPLIQVSNARGKDVVHCSKYFEETYIHIFLSDNSQWSSVCTLQFLSLEEKALALFFRFVHKSKTISMKCKQASLLFVVLFQHRLFIIYVSVLIKTIVLVQKLTILCRKKMR